MSISRFAAAAVLGLGACGVATVVAAADTHTAQLATWTPKEQRFVYQGFTTHYSCDGLREKVRSALLSLGARKSLTVSESGCSSPRGGPEPFPGVAIKMQVLTPVTAATAQVAADPASVPAHWQTIDLRLDQDTLGASGDCELLEQIKQSILPLFTTRNIQYSSNCVPHQLSTGGTQLRVEILVPDAPDVKPAAKAAQ
ncbi:MAG TPA: hypothetical protein VIE42_15765 [Steroidobacteraceae bacterium]|jgi:hypothetical protein